MDEQQNMTEAEQLLPIGEFARWARLSQKALRMYASSGLLKPRETDPCTGYRRYSTEQLPSARLIALLRGAGLASRRSSPC